MPPKRDAYPTAAGYLPRKKSLKALREAAARCVCWTSWTVWTL